MTAWALLALTVVSLAGTALNAWLNLRGRAEQAEFLAKLDERFLPRKEFKLHLARIGDHIPALREAGDAAR